MADKTTLSIGVQFVSDSTSISTINREAEKLRRDLDKKLRGVEVNWKKVAKSATAATSEINAISDSAAVFAKKLSAATISSVGHLKKLGDELDKAKHDAEELAKVYKTAEAGAKEGIAAQMDKAAEAISDLTHQIDMERMARHKEVKELEKVVKIQQKYQKRVKDAIQSDSGMFEGAKNKVSGGSFKGLLGDFGAGIKKSLMGGIARRGEAKAASANLAAGGGEAGMAASASEIAKAGKMLGSAALALGAAVAGFSAFIALVKAASDHMTGLNKALIGGMGYANDFVSDAKGYRGVMDEMRGAAINSAGAMLRFGKNSKDTMEIINAYAKESTGSLIKTRNTMVDLGGSVESGMQEFATNAIVYGKALNMEAADTAAMMGKFQTEMGYGANQVQDLMQDVVKSAATASMPMSKFMEIFKSVTPDVELYRNRLEELTGTIKLLSKTMSPRDVQQFMDAFKKGFGGTDFKQRLKTVFVAGIGNVNKVLEKGFSSRADTMAKKFGVSQKEFQAAFKGGEKGMAAMVNKLQAQGKQLSGTDIGEAMKLASYEGTRQKGGPLNTATALRGASMGETYQILKKMSQRFGTGFDGLNEHVIAQLGISEQQYLAMRQTNQSMQVWSDQIQKTGRTSSKSLNEGIARRMMAQDDKLKDNNEALKAFAKMSGEDQERMLFEASAEHEENMGKRVTMEDLTQEQVTATTSISEKITNVIAFLLEKLYNVLQPILDLLDDVWGWLTGNDNQKEMIKEMKSWRDDSVGMYEKAAEDLSRKAAETKDPKKKAAIEQEAAKQGALAEEMRMFGEKFQGNVRSGTSGGDLVKNMISPETLVKNRKQILDMITKSPDIRKSMEFGDSDALARFRDKESGNDPKDLDVIYRLLGSGRTTANVMALGRDQVASQNPSEEAARKAKYRGATKREGTKEYAGPKNIAEREKLRLAEEASDIDEIFKRDYPGEPAKTRAGTEISAPISAKTKETTGVGAGDSTGAKTASVAPNLEKMVEASKTTSETSALNLEKSDSMVEILAAIKTATESINIQSMGMSMHLGDIKQFMKGPGIHLNKSHWKNDSVEAMRSMFDEVLEEELTMFLFSLIQFMGEEGEANRKLVIGSEGARAKLIGKGGGISTLAGGQFTSLATLEGRLPDPLKLGHRDFGGDVPVTGMYRLQKGEMVTRRGEGDKSVAISATININGANDPHMVASIVRNEIYKLENKH
jgi:hypothetical protein